jgi:hypothetical protein
MLFFIENSQITANSASQDHSKLRVRQSEMKTMFQINRSKRIQYTRALYLGAVATLLAACTQTDPVAIESAEPASATLMSADVPEVVITASRG